MIPPASAPDFLTRAGWQGAEILPLAGDASFRRYFRVCHEKLGDAVLMDAPPEHEDVRPFISIADHLDRHGLRAPRILARDVERGLLLLEDFGDDRVGPVLAKGEGDEEAIYKAAVDTLVELHERPLPDDLPPYDEAQLRREVELFPDWYMGAVNLDPDRESYLAAWSELLPSLAARSLERPVLVLRDYHADNLMLLRDGGLGLLDFQDALAGHPAYDLVSLLQDARRDVSPELEARMIKYFLDQSRIADREAFLADYQLLGAQRNSKILGIFTRLWKRDGKRHYLPLQPRVWGLLERNLAHEALAPVARWYEKHVPADKRAAAWSEE
ncbi:aminoglycoside phosphotransferase family protein [Sphingomicrobium lutaoense]|nr:phosphotransferase [Sphingomicrobium lutaoense]